jgi:hypothetical protein
MIITLYKSIYDEPNDPDAMITEDAQKTGNFGASLLSVENKEKITDRITDDDSGTKAFINMSSIGKCRR